MKISVNNAEVKAQSARLQSASSGFQQKSLSAPYEEQSINANNCIKTAYTDFGSTFVGIGNTTTKDARNIEVAGIAFEEFDNSLQKLYKAGK